MAAAEALAKRVAKKAASPVTHTEPEDLSDAKTQQEILVPDGIEVEIFGDKLRLYPLPVFSAVQFSGFAAQVLGEAQMLNGTVISRVGGVLVEKFLPRFIPFVVRSLHRPGASVEQSKINDQVAEIESKITAELAFGTFAGLFLIMTQQNNTVKAVTGQAAKN